MRGARARRKARRSADLSSCASSGIWLARAMRRRTAPPLRRLTRRSISGLLPALSRCFGETFGRGEAARSRALRAPSGRRRSRMSRRRSCPLNRRKRCCFSREGALGPASITARAVGAGEPKAQAPAAALGAVELGKAFPRDGRGRPRRLHGVSSGSGKGSLAAKFGRRQERDARLLAAAQAPDRGEAGRPRPCPWNGTAVRGCRAADRRAGRCA